MLLTLSFCSGYPDLNIEKPKAEILNQGVYLSAEIQPQANLHDYVVKLRWNKDLVSDGELIIRKFEISPVSGLVSGDNSVDGSENRTVGRAGPVSVKFIQGMALKYDSGNRIDSVVFSRKQYRYELWSGDQNIDSVDLIIPQDLDLRVKDLELDSSLSHVGRIYLGKDRSLITNGFDVSWNLFELYADSGSKIQTFKPKNDAFPGKSSGYLNLNIQKYSGDLLIDWRGKRGGAGATGKTQEKQGTKGARGNPAKYRSGHTVPDGDGGREYNPGECLAHPTNGARGGNGLRGYIGEKGGAGGDLNSIVINIKESVDNRAPKLISQAGSGGVGGEGGSGGVGGEGGEPGQHEGNCSRAQKGPRGLWGRKGPQGKNGEQGKIRGIQCMIVEGLVLKGKCENL